MEYAMMFFSVEGQVHTASGLRDLTQVGREIGWRNDSNRRNGPLYSHVLVVGSDLGQAKYEWDRERQAFLLADQAGDRQITAWLRVEEQAKAQRVQKQQQAWEQVRREAQSKADEADYLAGHPGMKVQS